MNPRKMSWDEKFRAMEELWQSLSREETRLESVLIHVNGVSEEVTDSDCFAHIVDLGGLLN
jgi:hypothetical protein